MTKRCQGPHIPMKKMAFDFEHSPSNDDGSVPFPYLGQKPVIHEHLERADASTLLATDVSNYGMKTVLAEEEIAARNYDEAIKLAKEAVDLAKHVHEPNNIYAAYAEGIWAEALRSMGSFKESSQRYREALKMYERHYRSSTSPEAVELVGATQMVAWNYLSQRDFTNATRAWSSALSLTERLFG